MREFSQREARKCELFLVHLEKLPSLGLLFVAFLFQPCNWDDCYQSHLVSGNVTGVCLGSIRLYLQLKDDDLRQVIFLIFLDQFEQHFSFLSTENPSRSWKMLPGQLHLKTCYRIDLRRIRLRCLLVLSKWHPSLRPFLVETELLWLQVRNMREVSLCLNISLFSSL